jgi:hypothetical protein
MRKEENIDILLQDNNTRALYYRIADNLPAFVKELEISAERGSAFALKELPIYKAMLELFNKSELGKHM